MNVKWLFFVDLHERECKTIINNNYFNIMIFNRLTTNSTISTGNVSLIKFIHPQFLWICIFSTYLKVQPIFFQCLTMNKVLSAILSLWIKFWWINNVSCLQNFHIYRSLIGFGLLGRPSFTLSLLKLTAWHFASHISPNSIKSKTALQTVYLFDF